MDIQCNKKGCDKEEDEHHHIIPKFMGGIDLDGRKYLCKKHHDIIGLMIPKQIWNFVPEDKKEECKAKVKSFTKWWLEIDDTLKTKKRGF